MGTLVAAYVACWLAVTLYILQLGGRQRKLLKRMVALQLRLRVPGSDSLRGPDC